MLTYGRWSILRDTRESWSPAAGIVSSGRTHLCSWYCIPLLLLPHNLWRSNSYPRWPTDAGAPPGVQQQASLRRGHTHLCSWYPQIPHCIHDTTNPEIGTATVNLPPRRLRADFNPKMWKVGRVMVTSLVAIWWLEFVCGRQARSVSWSNEVEWNL